MRGPTLMTRIDQRRRRYRSGKNAAMERRKARRPPLQAGHLRPIFPEMGSTARRAAGAPVRAPASSGAPSPLAFAGGEPKEARPARHDKRAAELWLIREAQRNAMMCLREYRRSWTFGWAGVDSDSRAIFSTGGRASPDAGRADWGRTWGARAPSSSRSACC
jgi:hypothetical protein